MCHQRRDIVVPRSEGCRARTYTGVTWQARKLYGCLEVTCSFNTLRAEMHGHITSVSGVCNMNCHPLNTHTCMQLANACKDNIHTLVYCGIKSMSPNLVYYNWLIVTHAQKKRCSFAVRNSPIFPTFHR